MHQMLVDINEDDGATFHSILQDICYVHAETQASLTRQPICYQPQSFGSG